MTGHLLTLATPVASIGLLVVGLAVLWRHARNPRPPHHRGGCGDCHGACPDARTRDMENQEQGFEA